MPSAGWWGDGASPVARWPGVTIDLPAEWRSATSRWETPDGRFFFDTAAAGRACDFFPRYLRHHIGEFAGVEFTLLDYQRLLLSLPLFGWKRTETGLRRFRKLFGFIPKGGGKSPWGAGTGLYLAFCDQEPGAEVYAVAADKKQARTVHDNARIMVETMQEIEPEFKDLFTVLRDEILCDETHSKYEVLSADASTAHGKRPHGVIFDELHAQKNRMLYEALNKSMVKRRQPLMLILTHAGYDDEGICYEEYEYAKNVLSGTIQDESCLPVIFEASSDEDWTSDVVWKRVNPGHGITVKHDGVAGECLAAQNEPRKRNDFLMFNLNRWVNQAVAWIPTDWWDACLSKSMPTGLELQSLPCAAGLDMGQKIDLTAFVVVVRHAIPGAAPAVEVVSSDGETRLQRTLNYSVTLYPFFWMPQDTAVERERADGLPYRQWARDGLITLTEGQVIDYDRVCQDIITKIAPRFPRLKSGGVGFDPAFATDISQRLAGAGFQTIEIRQNYQGMSEPSYLAEGLVKARRVAHDGHRVLRNHVENAAIKSDEAGRIKPVKPTKTSTKHIDGIVASIMGINILSTVPDAPFVSPFALSGGCIVRADGVYNAAGERL